MRRTWLGLVVVLALAGCGGGGGLEGTYSDDSGVVSYEFQKNGKVLITSIGGTVELDYEIDGDKVKVRAAEDAPAQVLTITEEGDLDMGMAVLKKQEE